MKFTSWLILSESVQKIPAMLDVLDRILKRSYINGYLSLDKNRVFDKQLGKVGYEVTFTRLDIANLGHFVIKIFSSQSKDQVDPSTHHDGVFFDWYCYFLYKSGRRKHLTPQFNTGAADFVVTGIRNNIEFFKPGNGNEGFDDGDDDDDDVPPSPPPVPKSSRQLVQV